MASAVEDYLPRIVDTEVESALASAGAVLLEGPKASGKTSTALQYAATRYRLDDERDARVRAAIDVDPSLLLVGKPPVLLDEWQVEPALWNLVRHEVDQRRSPGQFILTGSATPDTDVRRHSGAGRFSIIQLRPMTLFEFGQSTGGVSLRALFSGQDASGFDPTWAAPAARQLIAELIAAGGWPANLGKTADSSARANRDYAELIREYDLPRLGDSVRDPNTALRVMRSLARNIATSATVSTIARDAGEPDSRLTRLDSGRTGADATSRPTVADHLDALTRLRIVEDQPAWSVNLRSARRLRTSPKRHFVDPSLAAAVLGLGPEPLAADPLTLGFLFESLAVRDLRVYAQPLGGRVAYYRDNRGLEADAVVTLPDGRWGAIEIKLGTSQRTIDEAARNLLRVADAVDDNRRAFLAVVTNGGIAHRRGDGVQVVPLRMLGP